MDTEFHYYITHLIAARAGLRGDDLRVLGYASQFTDDNDFVYQIRGRGMTVIYRNRISQTLNPVESQKARLEIYPLFHFIPGDPNAASAARRDGQTHVLNTTPNSDTANRIIEEALATRNFYQIGIAVHAYVDTWAHQNFLGFQSGFNGFRNFVDDLIPNIGHADARTRPDQPRLVWDDERLVSSSVNNKQRFLDAADHLFAKLKRFVDSSISSAILAEEQNALRSDLDAAIGSDPREDPVSDGRLDQYRMLAERTEYGAASIPEYNKSAWFKTAVNATRAISNPRDNRQTRLIYRFNPGYETSDWYRFQTAVNDYAERTKAILCENPAIAAEYNS